MRLEGIPHEVESTESDTSSRESRKQLSYREAVQRYYELKDAVPEAEKLMFRERPATSNEEKAIAKLELQIEGHESQAEAYAQQGDAYAERVMRMLAQFKEAEKTILEIYCDALGTGSEEFAEILREEHPWLGEAIEGEETGKEERLPREAEVA
jgi:hypothetical protein